MQIENILEIIYGMRKDYKGTQIMRELLTKNETFRTLIIEGIKTGNVFMWPNELWEELDKQNLMLRKGNVSDIFKAGANIGDCTGCSTIVSYSFPIGCLYVGGTVDYLVGTKNSPDGRHTWIEYKGIIYDTTFMLAIKEEYSKKLTYKPVYKTDPNKNPNYSAGKDFARDPFIGCKVKSK
jgi:hypothetical protein